MTFPWLAAITPGALFLLMALFMRLDMDRHRPYCPLYLAGKGISVISTMFWFFFTRTGMMSGEFFDETVLTILPGVVLFFMLGDLLSAWIVIKLMRRL